MSRKSEQREMEDDSSDDYEYFLQPVANEYNINDRIKEANQELYSTPYQNTDAANRKVRFRENLEDFESDDEHEKNSSQSSAKEETIIDEFDQELNIEETAQVLEMDVVADLDVSEICEQIEELQAKNEEENDNDAEDDILSTKSDLSKIENPESIPKVVHLPCCDHKTNKKTNCIQKCFPKKITKKGGKVNPSNSDEESRERKHKTCCQHKHSDEYIQKLPRYNGQNSVYGLSQEQLQKREYNLQKSVHLKQMKEEKTQEQKKLKNQDNEDAFENWLFRKMQHPKNNVKNMFDVKCKFGKLLRCKKRKRSEVTEDEDQDLESTDDQN